MSAAIELMTAPATIAFAAMVGVIFMALQIGAAVMANEGKAYQEILSHYYRGAEAKIPV